MTALSCPHWKSPALSWPPEFSRATTEAHIESVDHSGLVRGWARGPASAGPVRLGFWLNGARVGGATAASFRRDLLAAGHGHGHYGFQGQIECGVALAGELQLRAADSDADLDDRILTLEAPAKARERPTQTVESLLAPVARWNMADVEAGIEALELERNLIELREKRFFARVSKFLLGRWPKENEEQPLVADLRKGVLSADDVFKVIINGEERRNNGRMPESPYDCGFPFRLTDERRASPESRPPVPPTRLTSETNYLAAATLISPPWSESGSQLHYDEQQKHLLCHPPAEGATVAKIDRLAISGSGRVQVRVSVGHARSQPIEFAIVVTGADATDADELARFLGGYEQGVSWHRVSCGAGQLLQVDCAVGAGPAKLYIGTRMAPRAANHYFAWAHFSDLSVVCRPAPR